ncbi:response regulator [Pseudoduganella sp. SL102]|uniref:response regulator n=1 Tax=Pseudoduganella sp. SL102 TaxID=2995154 RepID=UPI00248C8137|nr:response regulator [Pseudoduganella sp. SL102]WBS00106.1 response regulator [Pseudoduganella sp. SL102]
MEARSDGAGKGSRFVGGLPLAQGAAVVPASPDPGVTVMKASSGAKLVIVDDNVDSAETLAMALELFGHLLRTAHTGADALREIEAFGPSVAVLTIGLRSMSRHDLARRIRAQPWGDGIVLIAVPGWGQESDKRAAAEAGFDVHLTKLVDLRTLNEEVARLLRAKAPWTEPNADRLGT